MVCLSGFKPVWKTVIVSIVFSGSLIIQLLLLRLKCYAWNMANEKTNNDWLLKEKDEEFKGYIKPSTKSKIGHALRFSMFISFGVTIMVLLIYFVSTNLYDNILKMQKVILIISSIFIASTVMGMLPFMKCTNTKSDMDDPRTAETEIRDHKLSNQRRNSKDLVESESENEQENSQNVQNKQSVLTINPNKTEAAKDGSEIVHEENQ